VDDLPRDGHVIDLGELDPLDMTHCRDAQITPSFTARSNGLEAGGWKIGLSTEAGLPVTG
jgi:hypothetical protein